MFSWFGIFSRNILNTECQSIYLIAGVVLIFTDSYITLK
jgi:hypothetical protein